MTPEEVSRYEAELTEALRVFDNDRAIQIARELATGLLRQPGGIPEMTAKRIMAKLRRKRRFSLVSALAEALIQSGQRTPLIRRQYAQALIDQDNLTAAELVLQSILQDSQVSRGEGMEARGLMGRI